MDGEWVKPLVPSRQWRYYRNIEGKRTCVINYSGGSYLGDGWPTSIIILAHGEALIYNGEYTREEALQFYRIAVNAENSTTAHRAVLTYMRMRGMK